MPAITAAGWADLTGRNGPNLVILQTVRISASKVFSGSPRVDKVELSDVFEYSACWH